jgi:cell pole-organizing protein PopZ
MSQINTGGEQSMDDILASIRRMIATEPRTAARPVSEPAPPVAAAAPDDLLTELVEAPRDTDDLSSWTVAAPAEVQHPDAIPAPSLTQHESGPVPGALPSFSAISDTLAQALASVAREPEAPVAAAQPLAMPTSQLAEPEPMAWPAATAAAPVPASSLFALTPDRATQPALAPLFGASNTDAMRLKPFDLGQLRPVRHDSLNAAQAAPTLPTIEPEVYIPTLSVEPPHPTRATLATPVAVVPQLIAPEVTEPELIESAVAPILSHVSSIADESLLAELVAPLELPVSPPPQAFEFSPVAAHVSIADAIPATLSTIALVEQAAPAATAQPEPTPIGPLPPVAEDQLVTVAAPANDDAVADLLRPMLRQWLDDNMPRIVEKALRSGLDNRKD